MRLIPVEMLSPAAKRRRQERSLAQERAMFDRIASIPDAIEGKGCSNYLKAVVYEPGGPRHVLLYLFEDGARGEEVAREWLRETRAAYGRELVASVYRPCRGHLAALPVVGVWPEEALPVVPAALLEDREEVAA